MQKAGFILIFIIYNSISAYSQVSDKDLVDRLYHTGKVWGYLKYHHSNITQGLVDWDSLLIASLDGIKTAPTYPKFQDSFNQLLFRAGPLSTYIDYWAFRGDNITINRDFIWFNDPYLTSSIKDTLAKIKTIFKNEASHYLSHSAYDPLFTFDSQYARGNVFPEENFRILAVYRYWNIINYFYHFKPKLAIPWDTVLKRTLYEVIKSKTKEDYALALRRMTKSIDDSKGFFNSPVYDSIIGYAYCPIRLRTIENKTIISNKLALTIGLDIGDEVIEFNDIPIETYRNQFRALAEGSNQAAIERNVNELVIRGAKDKFSVKVLKADNSSFTYDGQREIEYKDSFINLLSQLPYKDTVLNDGCTFGIIDMTSYHLATNQKEMIEKLWNTDAWILDLRGTVYEYFSLFAPYFYPDSINYNFSITPNFQIPGEFYYEKYTSSIYSKPIYSKNIILLVNEFTRGNAEEFGISLIQRNNLTIIGSTTDGSGDKLKTSILLPGKITTTLPIGGNISKSKSTYHSIGIKPTHTVPTTLKGFRANRDEQLEFALKCVFASKNNIKNSPKNKVHLYPNPAQSYFVLEFETKSNLNGIEFFDILGKKIKEITLQSNQEKIDISMLESGFYFVKIKNLPETYKLIKQ